MIKFVKLKAYLVANCRVDLIPVEEELIVDVYLDSEYLY
jgi:hypothetical protein